MAFELDPLNSTSQVVGITGVYHYVTLRITYYEFYFLKSKTPSIFGDIRSTQNSYNKATDFSQP
jgi:hypothetical protein